jgi:hypothetical protein
VRYIHRFNEYNTPCCWSIVAFISNPCPTRTRRPACPQAQPCHPPQPEALVLSACTSVKHPECPVAPW